MKKIAVTISATKENYTATAVYEGVVIVTNKEFAAPKKDFKEAFTFHIEDDINDYQLDYVLDDAALLRRDPTITTNHS